MAITGPMAAFFILGILAALTCVVVGSCGFIFLLLLQKIGECQAEADAENALFPGAPNYCRIPHSIHE